MKILFTTIFYNRPLVSELYLLGLQRLKEFHDFDTLVVVSDDASAELCERYGVEHYYYENLPLGAKHNFMLKKCLEKDFDWLIHSGDDDVMSSQLFMDYIMLFQTTDYEYIKTFGLYFYDIKSKRGLDFRPKNTFGAFRAFKRDVLERVGVQCLCQFNLDVNIGSKTYLAGNLYSLPKYIADYYKEKTKCSIQSQEIGLWSNELNKTLDFSSESKLIECGVKAYIVTYDKPQIIDFKSEQNIWKFETYYASSKDVAKEEVLSFLSAKEIEHLDKFDNC